MWTSLIFLIPSIAAANPADPAELAANHNCYAQMNNSFRTPMFAEKTNMLRQVARTMGPGWKISEYALYDSYQKKLSYIQIKELTSGANEVKAIQADAPFQLNDKYVLVDKRGSGEDEFIQWASCPVSFVPKRGVASENAVLYSNPVSYEDCSDKMGVVELDAKEIKVSKETAEIFKMGVVKQLQNSNDDFFKKNVTGVHRELFRRSLPSLEKTCLDKKASVKVQKAFLDYLDRVYTSFPMLAPKGWIRKPAEE